MIYAALLGPEARDHRRALEPSPGHTGGWLSIKWSRPTLVRRTGSSETYGDRAGSALRQAVVRRYGWRIGGRGPSSTGTRRSSRNQPVAFVEPGGGGVDRTMMTSRRNATGPALASRRVRPSASSNRYRPRPWPCTRVDPLPTERVERREWESAEGVQDLRVPLGRRSIDADRRKAEIAGDARPGRRVVDGDERPGQEILHWRDEERISSGTRRATSVGSEIRPGAPDGRTRAPRCARASARRPQSSSSAASADAANRFARLASAARRPAGGLNGRSSTGGQAFDLAVARRQRLSHRARPARARMRSSAGWTSGSTL